MVVHGNRLELLRELLIDWVSHHPLAPLENELVLVQSNGVAQWLKLGFARETADGGLGVSAALQTMLPQRFVWSAYRQVLGESGYERHCPFDAEILTWRLMRLLPRLLGRPEFLALRAYLSDDTDQRKRYQLSVQLAALFQQYQLLRTDWLEQWEQGRDQYTAGRQGVISLPDTQRWQASLWRALIGEASPAEARASRPATHARFLQAVRDPARPRPRHLPQRIILFGLSSLPVQTLESIAALGRWCQVLMCVLNPCRHDWSEIISDHDLFTVTRKRYSLREGSRPDHHPDAYGHPLLAAWGRQGRDLIRLLDAHDDRKRYERWFSEIGQRIDLFEEPDRSTLLGQLQSDVLDLQSRAETQAHALVIDPQRDQSISFHVCHSPQREVEVLHDQLLAAIAGDTSLEPRDILVMVPDIALYAPHIQAVFGRFSAEDARHLPFSVADASSRHADPIVLALSQLLRLPVSRLTANEVLNLLDVPAIQRRFGIAPHDLPKLRRWVEEAGIRWGFDAEHVAEFVRPVQLGNSAPSVCSRSTWRAGLDRLLFGYAAGSDQYWEGVASVAIGGAIEATLIGALDRFVRSLDTTRRLLNRPCRPSEWADRLRDLIEEFFQPAEQHEGLTVIRLQQALLDWLEATDAASFDEPLPVTVVRDPWLASLDADSLGRPFLGGGVTFATLTPMRAIPFRLIALLGMSDESYPRRQPPADFDLISRDTRPGDRSRREDDRYLFLEALLSARERLLISWVGRSNVDDGDRPPSILVAQLRDHIDQCWTPDSGLMRPDGSSKTASEALTLHHPLQAFSKDYFSANSDPRLFSYAHEWREALAAREAQAGAKSPTHVGLQSALKSRKETLTRQISLSDLKALLRNPASIYFRGTLGVMLPRDPSPLPDDECLTLDHLQLWKLEQELLQAGSTGQSADLSGGSSKDPVSQKLRLLAAKGLLPAGGFEALAHDALAADMSHIFTQLEFEQRQWETALPSESIYLEHAGASLTSTVTLIDQCTGLRQDPSGARARIEVIAGKLGDGSGRHPRMDKLLNVWVDHLAAHLSGVPLTTIVIAATETFRLAPLEPKDARNLLIDLCEAFLSSTVRPLPIAPRTAFAWLQAAAQGSVEQHNKAREVFEVDHPERHQFSERTSAPLIARCFKDFDSLLQSGEFDRWCQRLYEPVRQAVEAKRLAEKAAAD